MKKTFLTILLAITAYSLMAQSNLSELSSKKVINTSTTVQLESGSHPFPLAGTWTLKAAEIILPDGTHVIDPGLGKEAKGRLMIDVNGYYSLQIFRPDRPKFVSGNKRVGSAAEYESALLGMSTHYGHIKMDTTDSTLEFNIDYAAFPNWEHTSQTRQFKLHSNELYYQVPANAGAGRIAVSIWKRE